MRYSVILFVGILLQSACTKQASEGISTKPMEELFFAKNFPNEYPNLEVMEHGIRQAQSPDMKRSAGVWVSQGPGNTGARVTTFGIHPTNDQVIFAGYANGGLWRTTDGGNSWKSVFDDQAYLAIGHICFDPIDPNTIYVGTGDPDLSGYPRIGGGMYVSNDLGNTWTYRGLIETRIISKIEAPKNAPGTMYVAAMGLPFIKNNNKGVYKTNDYGQSWSKILFINDSAGISDLVVHPTDPNTVYAVSWNRLRSNTKSLVSGPDAKIYKTTNGGATWDTLKNGLPTERYSRMGLAISQSNPNVLYVSYTNPLTFNLDAIYQTSDAGNSWTLHTKGGEKELLGEVYGGFGWYFGKLYVNPQNQDEVYLLGVPLMQYNKANDLWMAIDYLSQSVAVHADKHAMVIRNGTLYLATDGGMYKTQLQNIAQWEDMENIPTTELYRTAYDPHRPDLYWCGAQDNGTNAGGIATGINDWKYVFGGDGFQMQFDPVLPSTFYVEYQRGIILKTIDDGQNFFQITKGLEGSRHWDMQYIVSSHDPNMLYTATDRVYRGDTNAADTVWTAISPTITSPDTKAVAKQATTLDQSNINKNLIYVGTSDGQVWATLTEGVSWQKINSGLPLGYISSLKASPNIENNVYITIAGYKDNDYTPKVYKSTDNGTSWQWIGANLPSLSINDVYIMPFTDDKIILVATDGGVYFTVNGGNAWERLGTNFPLIPVFDMDYDLGKNRMIAATFGRGIQTFDLDQININPTATNDHVVQQLQIYPTVAFNEISIENFNQEYCIYDLNHKSMAKGKNPKVDVTSYPQGMYIVTSGNKKARFIKI